MKVIGVGGTETEKEISPEMLKVLLASGLMPSIEAKRKGLLGKVMLSGYERWGLKPEVVGEREITKGLELVEELSEVKRQVDDLNSQVESVKSELKQCKEGISRILDELREKPVTKQTELFEIDETLEVIRPIPVVIEEYGDEVVASFPEIEAFGAGLCEAEAIIDLKNEIKKTFFELEEVSEEELGKLPLSWKRVLSKVVKKIGNSQ